jgi:PKD repeat protein
MSVSPAMVIGLTSSLAAIVIIIILLLAANVTITNAQEQQQQQLPVGQPAAIENVTTSLFQNIDDGFRVQVPEGWVIHDMNNTGSSASLEESTQGYGILAQLCPQQEEEEDQAAIPNAVGSNNNGSSDTLSSSNRQRCDQTEEQHIIHVVRYPDLDTKMQLAYNISTANNNITADDDILLLYHLQKLQEVGYRNITIINSTYTAVNIANAQTNQTITIVPAQFVEMTYRTAISSPNEIREGYFILTATNATYPNPGMTKGYSIFYEGTSTAAGASTVQTSTPSSGLPNSPAVVRQVFDSFELIAAPEVIAQDMLAAQSEQAQEEPTSPLTVEITSADTEEEEEEEEGGGEAIAPATFEFEADVQGGTGPYTYSWDFDDGASSAGESNEQTVSHTFEEAGSYDISLTVTDSRSQNASDSIEISVEEEAAAAPPPVVEEEVVEEEPIPPMEEEEEVEEEDVEEDVQEQPSSLADEIAESIEDDVDAFVDDILARFGVNN